MNSPDIVAQEQAVGILGLEGLLALDGSKPPGVVNNRPETVTCVRTTFDKEVSGGLRQCQTAREMEGLGSANYCVYIKTGLRVKTMSKEHNPKIDFSLA